MNQVPTPLHVTEVFSIIERQIESPASLSGPDFPCLGRLAKSLQVFSRDDGLGVMVLTSALSPRDDTATMVVRLIPGFASVGLILPSALSSMASGSLGASIVQSTGASRLPMTLDEELFSLRIDLRADWDPAAVAARILHDLRLLWLHAMQAALNLNGFGARTTCPVLSSTPLSRMAVAQACGDEPILVIQSESRLDGQILSFVECHLPEDILRQKLAAAGLRVVGSQTVSFDTA